MGSYYDLTFWVHLPEEWLWIQKTCESSSGSGFFVFVFVLFIYIKICTHILKVYIAILRTKVYIFNSGIVSAIDLGSLTWAHYKPWIQSQDWICSFFNLMLGPNPAIGIRFGSISGDGFNWYRYTKGSRWGQKSRHSPWTPLIVSVNSPTFHYQQQVPSILYQMHPCATLTYQMPHHWATS